MGLTLTITGKLTEVDDEPRYDLGVTFTKPNGHEGEQTWVYCMNDSGGALVEGHILMRKGGSQEVKVVLTTDAAAAAAHRVVCVAQHAVGSGKYFWGLQRGVGKVLAGTAGVTANKQIVPDGARNGAAEDMATGEEYQVIGVALESKTDNNVAVAFINCLGV